MLQAVFGLLLGGAMLAGLVRGQGAQVGAAPGVVRVAPPGEQHPLVEFDAGGFFEGEGCVKQRGAGG